MEKVKLILLLFSISIYSQSETLSQNDLINTKKIADSLLKNKNYLEATNYYEKLVIYKADNLIMFLIMLFHMVYMLSLYLDYNKLSMLDK